MRIGARLWPSHFVRKIVACAALGLAGVASAAPVHLRWVVWGSDESMTLLRNELVNFERAHPDIRVDLENANSNYQEKLLVQVAAGTAPDVAMMDPPNFQRFALRGALLPLDDFIAHTPGFDLGAYYPQIVRASSLNGKLYILPRDIAPTGLVFYNKDLFRKKGIPFPDGSWTWDFKPRPELREKCFTWVMRQLQEKAPDGHVTRWSFATNYTPFMAQLFVYSLGGRFADDPEHPTRITYDDPRVLAGFEFLRHITYDEQWVPDAGRVFSGMQTSTGHLFAEGKIAMYLSGSWDFPFMRGALKKGQPGFFDWDVTLAPAYKDGARAFATGGSGYSILSGTRHPREAWELVRWMAGPHGMLALAHGGDAQPAIRALARSEPWIPGPHSPPEERYPANRIVTDEAVKYVVFAPSAEYWPEVNDYVMQKAETIFNGSSATRPALLDGNRNAQRRLDLLLRDRKGGPFPWGAGAALGLLAAIGLGAWVYAPERGKRRTARERKEAWAAYGFLAPWLVGFLGLTLGPMLLSFLMSFADWDTITPARWRGLENYHEAFAFDPRFWTALKVTFVYSAVAVPLGLAFGLGLSLLLNVKVRGIPFFRTCYYLPSVASTVAVSLIWQKIFSRDDGLLNLLIYGADGKSNFLGLASLLHGLAGPTGKVDWLGNESTALPSIVLMSLWGIGGTAIILLASLQSVPPHYYEAATVDGAGPWRRFRNVTVPLISPALFFSLITGVIGSFQVFTQAFVMTSGGPNDATMFYMLHLYNQAFLNLRMGYASALAWLLFLIVMAFTALQLSLRRWVYYEGEEAR